MKSNTKKPTISKRDASRLVAEAAAKVYSQSGSNAGDPKALGALLDADRVDLVANMKVRPLLLSTFLTLEEMWRMPAYTNAVGSLREAMTLYAYCEPERARASFGRSPEKFVEECRAWAAQTTVEQTRELSELASRHIADFYGTSAGRQDQPKKKPKPARSKSGRGT